MPEPIRRTTARVLPVNREGAVLLLLERDPTRPTEPYWGTIGGAVDPEESLAGGCCARAVGGDRDRGGSGRPHPTVPPPPDRVLLERRCVPRRLDGLRDSASRETPR